MGIELDILTGHPEHDILFIATQVARASGLANPAVSVNSARRSLEAGRALGTLIQKDCISLPKDGQHRDLRVSTVMFSEPETYQMLLRGHAPHVARASGLANPSVSVCKFRKISGAGIQAREIHQKCIVVEPSTIPPGFRKDAVLFTEPETYQMLLRGHAPQSEPFRKGVTEVVLPSIRKTGKFDANEAQDSASVKFSGEFAQLHAARQIWCYIRHTLAYSPYKLSIHSDFA